MTTRRRRLTAALVGMTALTLIVVTAPTVDAAGSFPPLVDQLPRQPVLSDVVDVAASGGGRVYAVREVFRPGETFAEVVAFDADQPDQEVRIQIGRDLPGPQDDTFVASIAAHPDGVVWVRAVRGSSQLPRVELADENLTVTGGFEPRDATGATFRATHVAAAPGRDIYVTGTRTGGHAIVARFTIDGTLVATFEDPPTAPGQLPFAPTGLAVGPDGTVAVLTPVPDRFFAPGFPGRVVRFDADGRYLGEFSPAPISDPDASSGGRIDLQGIAITGDRAFVADSMSTRIRAFRTDGTPAGEFAGAGKCCVFEGQSFDPVGLATDGHGRLFVADRAGDRIQVFTTTGAFVTQYGVGSRARDTFFPLSIATDGHDVFVGSDWGTVHRFHADGAYVASFTAPAELGDAVEPGSGFTDVDVHGEFVYVLDSNTQEPDRNRVLRFSRDGRLLSTFGSPGTEPGQFTRPTALSVAPDGRVLVADFSDRVHLFSPEGEFLSSFLVQAADGSPAGNIDAAVMGPDGSIFVLDHRFDGTAQRVLRFDAGGTLLDEWVPFEPASSARSSLVDLDVSEDGQVFVAVNHHFERRLLIRRFDADGTLLDEWGESGTRPSELASLRALAVAGGEVYVADAGGVKVFTIDGVFARGWNEAGVGDVRLHAFDVAVDGAGRRYVVRAASQIGGLDDVRELEDIVVLSPSGALVDRVREPAHPFLDRPRAVQVRADGTVVVADTGNGRIKLYRASGATSDIWDANDTGAAFTPEDIALGPTGELVVLDRMLGRPPRLLRLDERGALLGEFGTDLLRSPTSVTVAPDSTVYVTDFQREEVLRFGSDGALLGTFTVPDHHGNDLNIPDAVVAAPDNTVYVAQRGGFIDHFTPDGDVLGGFPASGISDLAFSAAGTLLAAESVLDPNTSIEEYTTDGTLLRRIGAGRFGRMVLAVSEAPDGTMVVADRERSRVLRLTRDNALVVAWGSPGTVGNELAPGTIVGPSSPRAVAFAPTGELYVADTGSVVCDTPEAMMVHAFDERDDYVHSFAGEGTGPGQLCFPRDMEIGPDGTVYVTDRGSLSTPPRVKAFRANGEFIRQWGTSGSGPGEFGSIGGLAVAADGTLLVADPLNHRLQRFTPTGQFVGEIPFDGVPQDVGIGLDGDLYVAAGGHVARLSPTGEPVATFGNSGGDEHGDFGAATDVVVDGRGQVLVLDATGAGNGVLRVFGTSGSDETPPTTRAEVDPAVNHEGWVAATAATVTLTATDPTSSGGASGVRRIQARVDGVPHPCPEGSPCQVTVSGEGVRRVGFHAEDMAGNLEAARMTVVQLDGTAPTLDSVTVSPAEIEVGGRAELRAAATDATSGVEAAEWFAGADPGPGRATPIAVDAPGGPGGATITASIGAGLPPGIHDVSVRVRDWAGNWSDTVTTELVVADPTAPVVAADVAGTLGENGWYTDDVTVTWTVTDEESEVVQTTGCEPAIIDADTAGVTLTCTATSAGGATAESVTVMRDATVPTVTCAAMPEFLLDEADASVSATVIDATSGPAAATVTGDADTSDVGRHEVTVTGVDNAGNQTTVGCPYQVSYAFAGFFAPIDPTTVNVAKAGRTLPVKWRLTDASGAPVDDPASFTSLRSTESTCSPADTQGEIEASADGSGLQYLGDGNWQFNWQTPKAYAGQCRTLHLTLLDGTTHTAEFLFR